MLRLLKTWMQSDRDEMTGLLNQRGIFDVLDQECNRSGTNGNDLGVLLCEIEDLSFAGTSDGTAGLQAFTELALTLTGDSMWSDGLNK